MQKTDEQMTDGKKRKNNWQVNFINIILYVLLSGITCTSYVCLDACCIARAVDECIRRRDEWHDLCIRELLAARVRRRRSGFTLQTSWYAIGVLTFAKWHWSLVVAAYEEVERALLLVLGCAVHCDRRQSFIENIQRFSVDVQEAIVDCIKQVHSHAYLSSNGANGPTL